MPATVARDTAGMVGNSCRLGFLLGAFTVIEHRRFLVSFAGSITA